MHKDFYHQKDYDLRADITFGKLLLIMVTIFAFFVLPAQLITYYQNDRDGFEETFAFLGFENDATVRANSVNASGSNPSEDSLSSSSGRVAGASTSIEETSTFNLNDSNFLLAGVGVSLVLLSLSLLVHLVQTEKRY